MAQVLDSSVWVALFLDFDTQHQKASQILEKLKDTVYVPYCVVSEVTTVLAYKHSKKQADNFIRFIESNRDLILLNDNMEEEMKFYALLKSKISFTDAALMFLSRKLKANLITFDKHLERLNKK
jgi:predicted nucleic acid-binding protein